jgi:ribosome-associated protein
MAEARSAERSRRKERGEPVPADLARGLASAALEKRAEDVVLLDLRGLTSMTDFFVVATVSTDVHSRAVSEAVQGWARETLDERPWHVEGEEGARHWLLLDYVDVVVHLFQPEARDYYGLERLWGDAPREEVTDEEIAGPEEDDAAAG